MLPKQHRLRRTRDFARVRRFGRSAGSDLVKVYTLSVRSPDIRVGFSVNKKVGKATIRNRVKRRMREAVRQELPSVRAGQDIVLIARPASANASYADLSRAISELLHRRGVMEARKQACDA